MVLSASWLAAALPTASTAAEIEVRMVETPGERRRFIEVPFTIHRDDPIWVPPLRHERRRALDRRRNPFFRHADVAFWIARRNGHDIGRISAQVDHRTEAGVGSFGMLASVDDAAVVAALLGTAERWLKTRDVRRALGPLSLSINQEAGLLVEGFETSPMFLMSHDKPWIGGHLETLGYRKAKDLYAFVGDIRDKRAPDRARLLGGAPSTITLRPLRRKTFEADIAALVEIFNDAWSENWGFAPLAPDEVAHMAREMRPLLNDRLVWFAEVRGTPAAFAVCVPNLNEAIRDLNGWLLPFGWARLLWRLKMTGVNSARLPLLGVRRRYADSVLGSKLAFMVIGAIHRECAKLGMGKVEMSWVLEDNMPVIRIIEALGGRRYKTYRLYEKPL